MDLWDGGLAYILTGIGLVAFAIATWRASWRGWVAGYLLVAAALVVASASIREG